MMGRRGMSGSRRDDGKERDNGGGDIKWVGVG
jgi:hypothetical protein